MKYSISSIFAAALLLLAAGTAQAQQSPMWFEGIAMQQAGLTADDLVRFGTAQPFGTARSMAMANAFTSLGGDLASATINPAGLGMYRSGEITLTPLLTMQRGSSNVRMTDRSKSRMTLGQAGLVFKSYEGSGTVTGVNIAFGYNRVADLNYRMSGEWQGQQGSDGVVPSILDVMGRQLDHYGFENSNYGENFPDMWGALMAYNGYLLDDDYFPYVGRDARIGRAYNLESRGSVNEVYFAVAMNFSNKLYAGITLGVQSLSQKKDLYYGEQYEYPQGRPADMASVLDRLHYNQAAKTDGVGVNVKIGFTWRPTNGLRVGLAVHTPTWFAVDHEYGAQMSALRYDADDNRVVPVDIDTEGTWTDSGPDQWKFTTPTRLLAGISYSFGTRGVVAVDYERSWYNAMRVSNVPYWVPGTWADNLSKEAFRDLFQGSNTLRIGGEFKPSGAWSLRAGYALTGNILRHENVICSGAMPTRSEWITAGVGRRFTHGITLDLTYQYGHTDYNDFRLFYSTGYDSAGVLTDYDLSEPLATSQTRHNIALTLGVRF